MSKKKTSQHKEPSWLVAQRKKAEKKFATLSMPTIKDDAWRYTNPALFTLIKKQSSRHLVLPVISQEQIDQGVIVEDLLTAAKKHLACVKQAYAAIQKTTDKHSTLNDAAWNQGIFIFVPDGVLVSVPITVRHGETTGASLCKTVLMLGKKSRLTYVEEYAGTGNYN
ncbi:MAG: hypothetical protein HZC29_01945, partial [Thaumarchaeota archaeon]|nr:hypothetical protein [Nitrososphaerota archaeon]